LLGALGKIFSHFPVGFLFLIIGLMLLPPVHALLEKKLRFRFTWLIKSITCILLFITAIYLEGKYDLSDQRIAHAEKQISDKVEKENQLIKAEEEKKEKQQKISFDLNMVRADSAANKKNYKKAILFIDEALKFVNGNSYEAYYKRASFKFNAKQYAESVEDYNYLINNDYKKDIVYYERAQCYIKQNKKQQAVEDLRQAKKLGNADADKLYEKINPERRRVAYYVTRCCDGSTSSSTGRGTCSHHGGVCDWNDPVYEPIVNIN